ncbi:hypothetical protein Ae201684P_014690 [Aphanomyces euteiches]|uniref:Uncharacterized protein n=1 Tax=Aphanomyces euteiches TaxID=100861 RepID=A0A6G0WXP8_9STRA|nr:hypothetical protein Ae201684_010626 [Aphanomyces euteiches]KAH9089935.1 hypothetical protein Ae201684P_014690 [Aphanomyces euteiches]
MAGISVYSKGQLDLWSGLWWLFPAPVLSMVESRRRFKNLTNCIEKSLSICVKVMRWHQQTVETRTQGTSG